MDKMLMKEVLSHTAFGMWPAVGLVIFTAFMTGVFLWVLRPGSRKHYEALRWMAIDEEGRRSHE